MARIIALQSFRRGTGKSLLTVNIGVLQAMAGRRVGLVDADFSAPALHLLCEFDETPEVRTLNDYLLGRCDIEQTAHDITPLLGGDASGRLFLMPASTSLNEISRMLRKGYDLRLLDEGFQTLIEQLALDILIVDTHAGLHEEALTLMALVDVLALVLRHDQQDYQGTAVMVEVGRRLDVPRITLIAISGAAKLRPRHHPGPRRAELWLRGGWRAATQRGADDREPGDLCAAQPGPSAGRADAADRGGGCTLIVKYIPWVGLGGALPSQTHHRTTVGQHNALRLDIPLVHTR